MRKDRKFYVALFLVVLAVGSRCQLLEPFRQFFKQQEEDHSRHRLHNSTFSVCKLKIGGSLSILVVHKKIESRGIKQALQELTKYFLVQIFLMFRCPRKRNNSFKTNVYKSIPNHITFYHDKNLPKVWIRESCQQMTKNTNNSIYNKFARTMCFSTGLSSFKEREELVFLIQENKLFHLNLSFVVFNFTAHLWCFTDFVCVFLISNQNRKKQLSNYIFCGMKPPWTILHTKNFVKLWTVAKPGSKFEMVYRIMESTLVRIFYICDSVLCRDNFTDSLCQSKVHSQVITMSHAMVSKKEARLHVFHLTVQKMYFLQIKCSSECFLYDSPMIGFHEIQMPFNATRTMSSFQAIAAVKIEPSLVRNQRKIIHDIWYHSKPNFGVKVAFGTKMSPNVYFSKEDQSEIVFDTRWLNQEPNYSFNITIKCFEYNGPEDPLKPNLYGGIALITISETGEQDEFLQFPPRNPCLGNQSEKLRDDSVSFTTSRNTKYVILTHYCYPPLSFVLSYVSLLKTLCSGVQLSLNYEFENLDLIFPNSTTAKQLPEGFNQMQIDVRPQSQCLVLHIKRTVQKRPVSLFHRTKFNLKGIFVFYPDGSWIREIISNVYKINYYFSLLGEFATIESLHQSPLGVCISHTDYLWAGIDRQEVGTCSVSPGQEGKMTPHLTRRNVLEFNKCLLEYDHFHRIENVAFVDSARVDETHFHIFIDDLESGWAEIVIQLTPCKMLCNNHHKFLLDRMVVRSLMHFHCADQFATEELPFVSTRTPVVGLKFAPTNKLPDGNLKDIKLAVNFESYSLQPNISAELFEFYVTSNISHNFKGGIFDGKYAQRLSITSSNSWTTVSFLLFSSYLAT